MDSILISIKKLLGISEEYKHYDQDIIMYINAVFATLTQLGVGPAEGFSIIDENDIWSDFIPTDPKFEPVKTYTYLKVRMMFDPPDRSSVAEAINNNIKELEWRINIAVDTDEISSNVTDNYVTKDQLNTAVSNINTRIDNIFNDIEEEIGGDANE